MSIEKRSRNTWRITVAAGRDPQTGEYRRVRETVTGTKADARRREAELEVELAHGTFTAKSQETLDGFLRRWVEHRQSSGAIRPRTRVVYEGYIEREVSPRIGNVPLTEVRPTHIQSVLDEASKRGLSARSVTQVYRVLHAALKTAVRWRILTVNPADGAQPPKVAPAKLQTPSASDIAKLVEEIEPEFRPMLALAAASGLRRGELCGLRWSNVELDGERGQIRVEGTLQRVDGELAVLEPKSARSRRTVPLSSSMTAMLRGVRTEQLGRRMLSGPAWRDGGDFIFDTGTGSPIDPDTFTRRFTAARNAVGLPGVRLHDLRHAFASSLVEAGVNVRVVSDLVGHASVGFTMQTYVHGTDEAAAAAVDTVERLLGEAR